MDNQSKIYTAPGFTKGHLETLRGALVKAAYHGLGKVINTETNVSINVRSAQRTGTYTQRLMHANEIADKIMQSKPSFSSAWNQLVRHYYSKGYTKAEAIDKVYDLNSKHGEHGLIEILKSLQ